MNTPHGSFCWNELATDDVEKAMAFYTEALGWEFEFFPVPDGPYWAARCNGEFVAGIGGLQTAAVPGTEKSTWFSVIEVDDVDARVAKAVSLGATILRPPVDVPEIGRFAVLRDPTGGAIGWMTSLKPEGGAA